MTIQPYKEIESISNLPAPDKLGHVYHCVFQDIDFTKVPKYAASGQMFRDCCFLGCRLPQEVLSTLGPGCTVFPQLKLAYNAFRSELYNGESLYAGFDPDREESFETCYDTNVYKDYILRGKEARDIIDTLGRSLHDHAIGDAMGDFLARYDEKSIVAVMGGHAIKRSDPSFREVALISKALTEKGRLMCSGGGPGAMEATHFGAWMAGRSTAELDDALSMLAVAPTFRDSGWLSTAFAVQKKYPRKEEYHSLGIPTWFYGHEPATPFASEIAKYFQNSVREDILLTIAKGGIIYSPGAAGTLQEIFQDAAQNHYETFGYASPMVFLGKKFFTEDVPVYPFLQNLLEKGRYKNLILSIADTPQEAVDAIMSFGR
ncbi:MAG: hypothetical protein K6E37_01575 [Bacteroidales bacterium]|nr:hypothetical protein [Bacteroidales bacterium]